MPGDRRKEAGWESGKCRPNKKNKRVENRSLKNPDPAFKDQSDNRHQPGAKRNLYNNAQYERSENEENQYGDAGLTAPKHPDQIHKGLAHHPPQSTGPKKPRREAAARSTKTGLRLPVYGALDLGTNNCRLLLARPNRRGFEIVDAFSRIIRLGEGMSETGRLSTLAMERTIEALYICSEKMAQHRVTRSRLVATEACRVASNNHHFIKEVKRRTGLELEIINQQTEAVLAVNGCVTLIDDTADYALVFDIGGGSSELIWLDINKLKTRGSHNYIGAEQAIIDWVSLPVGVVTLAEKFGGLEVDRATFREMVSYVKQLFEPFVVKLGDALNLNGANMHYLGTSGTVTTLAGVYLSQEVYDRQKIDGLWMDIKDVLAISSHLMGLTFQQRQAIPTIGPDRADLVLGGCAILEAMLDIWPTEKLRVADRGLREGILAKLMAEDGFIEPGQCWVSSPKRPRVRHRYRNRPPKKR